MLFKTLHSDGSDVFIHVDSSTSTNRLPYRQVFSKRKEGELSNVISKTNKVKWTADVIRTEISWCNSTAGTCGLARMRPWADQRVIFAHWPSLAPRQSSDSLSLLLFSLFLHSWQVDSVTSHKSLISMSLLYCTSFKNLLVQIFKTCFYCSVQNGKQICAYYLKYNYCNCMYTDSNKIISNINLR